MLPLNGESPLLVCEGSDDESILKLLLDHARIAGIQIALLNGIDPLAKKLQVLIKGIPGAVAPSTVALVLDADRNPAGRRASAQDALLRAAPSSRHRVYLFPDDAGTGMLEDLYLSACRYPGLALCARSYVACARESYPVPFNESKVSYDAYCGVVHPTQRAVQHGLSEGDVDPTHPALAPLIEFLRDLASPQ